MTQISEKIVSKSVCEMARSMPSLELNISISNVDDFVKMRDCFYLHELLADLVHIFIVEEREKEGEMMKYFYHITLAFL